MSDHDIGECSSEQDSPTARSRHRIPERGNADHEGHAKAKNDKPEHGDTMMRSPVLTKTIGHHTVNKREWHSNLTETNVRRIVAAHSEQKESCRNDRENETCQNAFH